jgi:hypothetical protein
MAKKIIKPGKDFRQKTQIEFMKCCASWDEAETCCNYSKSRDSRRCAHYVPNWNGCDYGDLKISYNHIDRKFEVIENVKIYVEEV